VSVVDSSSVSGATGELHIDLGALAANYRQLADRTGAKPAAMVKADAYGLGLEPVVQRLLAEGCRRFFAARLSEAAEARRVITEATRTTAGNGQTGVAHADTSDRTPQIDPIVEVLVLDGVPLGAERDLVERNVIPVLSSLDQIRRWAATAAGIGRTLPAALHLDTGMRRLGLPADEWAVLQRQPNLLDGLDLRQVMSHLACADDDAASIVVGAEGTAGGSPPDAGPSSRQLARFEPMRRHIQTQFPNCEASLANSAGIFCGPRFHFDFARPGIALYGGSPWGTAAPNPMAPVATVTVPVLQVQVVEAGEPVGYGATWTAANTTRVATLPVGYADGYHRSLSSRGWVAVADTGQRAPIVGRVSMDLTTIDVGHLPESAIVPGTAIELFGAQMPVDEVADSADTIAYELLTAFGSRYRRVYHP
jgi:alanine racemase